MLFCRSYSICNDHLILHITLTLWELFGHDALSNSQSDTISRQWKNTLRLCPVEAWIEQKNNWWGICPLTDSDMCSWQRRWNILLDKYKKCYIYHKQLCLSNEMFWVTASKRASGASSVPTKSTCLGVKKSVFVKKKEKEKTGTE